MAETYFGRYALQLQKAGYEPFPVKANDKEPAVKEWRSSLTEKHLKRWAANGLASASIGIKTGRTPAIDIDVYDEAMSKRFADAAREFIGDAPERIGQAPKRMLVCRADKPFRKLKRSFIDPKGGKHAVEILGEGQFFVAYGIHPSTKKPFTWTTLDEPTATRVGDLPLLTRETAIEILDYCARIAADHGWKDAGLSGSKSDLDDDGDTFGDIRPKAVATEQQIDEYMRWLPNEDADYDMWLAVGAALHHQYDGSDEGFDRWVEWSSRSMKHDEDSMEKKWKSFSATGTGVVTTFKTIIKWSNEARAQNQKQFRQDLIERIELADDEESVRALQKNIIEGELDPIDLDDLISRLAKAAKRAGWDTSKTYLRSVIIKERNALKRQKRLQGADKPNDSSIYDLEVALAEKVLNEHFAGGDHLKQFSGSQWSYHGGVWRIIEKEVVKRRVMETLETMKQARDGDYAKLLAATREAGRDDRMAALISSVTEVLLLKVTENGRDDPLNLQSRIAHPVINCRNGELWFDEGAERPKFREHNPEHRLTSQVACNFDPKAQCPEFMTALNLVFRHSKNPRDVMRHWLEVMGTLIQPRRPRALWVLMKGPGDNGKSFLMDIISSLAGPSSCLFESIAGVGKGTNNHFTASLVGKLMFIDDDVKRGTLLPDDWMKKLSEPKLLTANPKFAGSFEFTSRAVMVMLANEWPHTSDVSRGMQRRAQIFELPCPIPESQQDLGLKDRILQNELPGILNLLVNGWLRVLKRGGKFKVPEECARAHSDWMVAGNATARFVNECLIRDDNAYNMPAVRVYERYAQWARDVGEGVKPLGRNSFYSQLESMSFSLPMQSGRRMIKGVIIREVLEDDPLDGAFYENDGLEF